MEGFREVCSSDPEEAARDAIRHWPNLVQLAEFAAARHGFGDTNGGFGVTYPGDLDEYDREVDGVCVPEGFVLVYGSWGPPDGYELLILESVYLDTLVKVLSEAGHQGIAAQVRLLVERST